MDHRAEQGLKFFGEVMGEDRAKSLEQVVRAGGFGAAVGEGDDGCVAHARVFADQCK